MRRPSPFSRRRSGALLVALLGLAVAALGGGTAAWAQPVAAVPSAAASQAAVPAAAALAARYAATIRDGRATVAQYLTRAPGASLSLALVHDGRVVWRQGWGYADRSTQAPPGPDTIYGIASVSKVFAAAAIMKLVDEGKVELDAPVTRYLPSFTMADPQYRSVTVRMLLNHSSGLPGADYYNGSTTAYFPGYLAQVLATLSRARLKTTPGFMSVYSNEGFVLAEAVVAAVSGKSYAEFMDEELFAPLGMTRTVCPVSEFPDDDWAKAYSGDEAHLHEVSNALGSGGLYSTPSDLGKFGTMLANWGRYRGQRVLSRAAVAAMGTSQVRTSFNPLPSAATNFGLGWDTVTEPASCAAGVVAWAKNGGIADYHSSFMAAPRGRLVVAVTATTPFDTDWCDAIARRILVHALRDQGTIAKLPGPVSTTVPPLKRATEAQLAAMEGIYARSDGAYLVQRAAPSSQKLNVSMWNGDSWAPFLSGLRLRADGRFHAPHSPVGMWAVAAGGRRYLAVRAPGDFDYYANNVTFAEKLRLSGPTTDAWQGRVGHRYLLVSALPTFTSWSYPGAPLLQIGEIPGAPGFVTVTTLDYATQVVDAAHSDDVATMFLAIPLLGSRDVQDAVVERRGGEEWIRWSGGLFRPTEGVPVLVPGRNVVDIGAEGYAEWRTTPYSTGLRVDAEAWLLFDAAFTLIGRGGGAPANVTAPAGSWLLLYGPAGGSASVDMAAG